MDKYDNSFCHIGYSIQFHHLEEYNPYIVRTYGFACYPLKFHYNAAHNDPSFRYSSYSHTFSYRKTPYIISQLS